MPTCPVVRFSATAAIALTGLHASAAAQDCLAWRERSPLRPPRLFSIATTYDSARGALVVFGGLDGRSTSDDTWTWDDARWALHDTNGPPPLRDAGMAFDEARGIVVLFGGNDGSFFGETWEWDGMTWSLRSTAGPPARIYHAMFYHESRGFVTLYGGGGWNGVLGDLWEWNGIEWTQRDPTGPSPGPRYLHAMTYDPELGKAVMFGGRDATLAHLDDTWTWDGTEWQQLGIDGPSPRSGCWMAHDRSAHLTMLQGGSFGTTSYLETWVLEEAGWTQLAAPEPPSNGPMVYDSVHSKLVMFVLGRDLWEWSGDAWERRDLSPRPRNNPAMAFDERRGVTVLFGGDDALDSTHPPLGDTWEWEGTDWTLRSTTGPSPRYFHAMAYDRDRGVVVLHGGSAPGIEFGDVWEWDGTSWSERTVNSMFEVRQVGHSMVYDSVRRKIVIIGGDLGPGIREWDGAKGEFDFAHNVVGPSAWGGAAFDETRGRSVYRSGANQVPYTYEWDGTTWTTATLAGPRWRQNFSMAYDAARRETLMYGGVGAEVDSNTWGWDGVEWTLHSNLGPGTRHSHAMSYDRRREVTVLFGGIISGTGYRDDTWELGTGLVALDADSDCDVDLRDLAVLMNCVEQDPIDPECGVFDADGDGSIGETEKSAALQGLGGPIR